MKVAVLGLGYVGCVTAAGLADAGNSVVGIDPAEVKVAAISAGRSPIVEPGLAEMIERTVSSGRLLATSDLAAIDEVEVAIVCVGTPSAETGELDLRHVESVSRQIGARLVARSTPLTIMLRSTVLPGTTRTKVIPWIEEASGKVEGRDFFVAFCPEFLRESTALQDFANPPFTIVGVESAGAEALPVELLSVVNAPVEIVGTAEAESLKYASNAFHALKVTFANEMARVLHATGVDARTVMSLFVKDRELNISSKYLRPGFAFGGSCLPKDVRALEAHAREYAVDVPMLSGIMTSNELHIETVLNRVRDAGVKRVAVIGLTFKPGTDDLRESPYVKLAARLIGAGIEVRVYDPIIRLGDLLGANRSFIEATLPELPTMLHGQIEEALEGAELILLGTNHADVVDAVLDGPPVPVVDLSGMLPQSVEQRLRARADATASPAVYSGAAWS